MGSSAMSLKDESPPQGKPPSHRTGQLLSDEDGFVRISAADVLKLVPQIGIGENPIDPVR